MPLVIGDRVLETSSSEGTGTISLGGNKQGFQGFVVAIGNGNTTYYCITDDVQWEIGLGTVAAGSGQNPDTLTRDQVLSSSNGGAKVNWAQGTRNVFCTVPASKIMLLP